LNVRPRLQSTRAGLVSMRRFLQFGVRGLFILILIIAASLAWLVQAARVQRRAVDAIQARRGVVWYDWQRRSLDGWMGPDPDERPRWPNWIIDQFGVDLFSHVIQVRLVGASLSDENLVHVGKLRQLESLHLGGRGTVTDDGYAQLEQLSCLRNLGVRDTTITNRGLSHIAKIVSLQDLDLSSCDELVRNTSRRCEASRSSTSLMQVSRTPALTSFSERCRN
jgi:hypothetical protein